MNEIQKMPDVAGKIKAFGVPPASGNLDRLAKTNAAEHTCIAETIKHFGIQAD